MERGSHYILRPAIKCHQSHIPVNNERFPICVVNPIKAFLLRLSCYLVHSQFGLKLLSFLVWIKVMQQSLLVDLFVLIVPGKDETLPSIKVFLVEL